MESKPTVKKVCGVCGGKGGWKIKADFWWDNNWNDCPYCNGLCFVDEEEQEEENSYLLTYNSYKKKITDILDDFGRLISYSTTEHGKNIEISLIPTNKDFFLQFSKAFLKFGYLNKRLNVSVNQVLYYEPTDDLFHYYWKLVLMPDDISDLDGFIDLLKTWEDKLGKGRVGK